MIAGIDKCRCINAINNHKMLGMLIPLYHFFDKGKTASVENLLLFSSALYQEPFGLDELLPLYIPSFTASFKSGFTIM